jgi:membrane protein DedA with SNARE-associated domain
MTEQLLALLSTYKYVVLFPLSLVEAPLMSILGGFLVALGSMDIFAAYVIIIVGDFVGDGVLYVAGWWGAPFLDRLRRRLGVTDEKMVRVILYFQESYGKAIVTSKLVHGVGFTGLIVAGSLKVPFWRYALVCVLVTCSQSAVLMAAGVLSGGAYLQVARYFGYGGGLASLAVLVAIAVIVYRRMR